MNRLLACATAVGLLATAASAQVNYSFNFDANSTGWTGNFARFTGTTTCGGTGGAMRRNLWSSAPTGQLVSPSVGTSNGGTTTITFDYKAAVWSANTAGAPTPWGNFDVQYGATATGPWTTIANVANEAQTGSCINKSFTFSPAAGPLFIRFNCSWAGGDYWLNFDNVVLSESASACSGTPTPGNTIAPTEACSGAPLTLSLQNSTPGTGVTFQWYSSTVSATGPWSPVGTSAPTLATSQTVDSWYYCDVTCGGTATGSSAVGFVPMSTPASVQGWDTGTATPNCWSTSGGTVSPSLSTASAFGVGTGSVKFDFYSTLAGGTMLLTSPTFPALGSGQNVYFDVAGRTYVAEIDQIALQESNDGGTTWTTVVVMTNQTNFQGVLATLNAATPAYTPAPADWASLSYPLSAGTNRVRFSALSAYGNNVYLDNVSIGTLPSARHTRYGATCAAGFNLSAAPAPVAGTTFTFSQAGIPEAAPSTGIYFGVVVLSLGQLQPGVALSTLTGGIVDSPCNLNVTGLDVTLAYVSPTPTDSSVTFAVPATAPAGVLLYAQSAALISPVAPNNAGVVTSNGIRTFINTF